MRASDTDFIAASTSGDETGVDGFSFGADECTDLPPATSFRDSLSGCGFSSVVDNLDSDLELSAFSGVVCSFLAGRIFGAAVFEGFFLFSVHLLSES